jgi:HipA-like C-terminal domain
MTANQEFRVVNVSEWEVIRSEPMGGKAKDWRQDPRTMEHWLYKEVGRKSGNVGGATAEFVGEDWAEKIVSELAKLAGFTVADVDLASMKGRRGCILRSIVEEDEELVHGNELLWKKDETYPRSANFGSWYSVEGSVEAIRLRAATTATGSGDAAVSFASYLVLDAWVSNTDRHHENWGVLVRPDGRVRMAPSFDHGSSLGFNLTDFERTLRLNTNDRAQSVDSWARRGKSPFYAEKRQTLAEAAHMAAEVAGTTVEALAADLPRAMTQAQEIIARVPSSVMSPLAKEFALALLIVNTTQLVK